MGYAYFYGVNLMNNTEFFKFFAINKTTAKNTARGGVDASGSD